MTLTFCSDAQHAGADFYAQRRGSGAETLVEYAAVSRTIKRYCSIISPLFRELWN